MIYYAECLRIITENTAKLSYGSYIEAKLKDILDPAREDERTAEDIIEGIRDKLK